MRPFSCGGGACRARRCAWRRGLGSGRRAKRLHTHATGSPHRNPPWPNPCKRRACISSRRMPPRGGCHGEKQARSVWPSPTARPQHGGCSPLISRRAMLGAAALCACMIVEPSSACPPWGMTSTPHFPRCRSGLGPWPLWSRQAVAVATLASMRLATWYQPRGFRVPTVSSILLGSSALAGGHLGDQVRPTSSAWSASPPRHCGRIQAPG
mmetsp:Transcript_48324/g.155509  ORF Transcript_48324/g.155509 Transcript_48324/m.155509 type:complete len:210 (-) Transcript_48324:70-699(-)